MTDQKPFRVAKVKGLINITRVRQAERLEQQKLEKKINDISGEMRESIHQLNINSKTFTNRIQRIFKPRNGRVSGYPQQCDPMSNRRNRITEQSTKSTPSAKTLQILERCLSNDMPPDMKSEVNLMPQMSEVNPDIIQSGGDSVKKENDYTISAHYLVPRIQLNGNKLPKKEHKEEYCASVNVKSAAKNKLEEKNNLLKTSASGQLKQILPRQTQLTPVLSTKDEVPEKIKYSTEGTASNALHRPYINTKHPSASETYFVFDFPEQWDTNNVPVASTETSKTSNVASSPRFFTPDQKPLVKQRKPSLFAHTHNNQKHTNRQDEYINGRRNVLGSHHPGKHEAEIVSSGLKSVFGAQPKKEVAHVVYEFLRVARTDETISHKQRLRSLEDSSYEELRKCRYLRGNGLGKSL